MSSIVRRTTLRLCVFAVAVLALARTTSAQTKAPLTQPSVIPIELASALVVSGGLAGSEEPRILTGSAPEWVIPKIVVPSGARVLGAAFQGTTVLAIVNIPGAGDSIVPELKAQLLARGWKPQPSMTNGFVGGGFRPAPTPVSEAAPTRVTVCDMPQVLTASVARRDAKSVDIAYRISTVGSGYSVCNPPQSTGMPAGYKSPFPALYNPQMSADARMTGDCQSSLVGSQGTSTLLRTAMSTDLILDHYAKQLADSGWTPAVTGATITKTFTRMDAGSAVELTLSVASSTRDQTCRDVNMSVKTLRKP